MDAQAAMEYGLVDEVLGEDQFGPSVDNPAETVD